MNRKFGPFVEILRCLLYFIFEYLLIGPFGWYISKDRLTFTTNLYFIRMTHIFSIIFWVFYILINSKYKCFKTQSSDETVPQNATDVEDYKHGNSSKR